jgi:hypothetical protein
MIPRIMLKIKSSYLVFNETMARGRVLTRTQFINSNTKTATEADGFPLDRAALIEEIKQLRAAVDIYRQVVQKRWRGLRVHKGVE